MGANGRSPYCATKFGVEAISDCLRLEMKKFNVEVTFQCFSSIGSSNLRDLFFARFALLSLEIISPELLCTMRMSLRPRQNACGMAW